MDRKVRNCVNLLESSFSAFSDTQLLVVSVIKRAYAQSLDHNSVVIVYVDTNDAVKHTQVKRCFLLITFPGRMRLCYK